VLHLFERSKQAAQRAEDCLTRPAACAILTNKRQK